MRRKTFEIRITVSAILHDGWQEAYPSGYHFGWLKVVGRAGWRRFAHINLVGSTKTRTEYSAMQRALKEVRHLLASGVETTIYIEEKA